MFFKSLNRLTLALTLGLLFMAGNSTLQANQQVMQFVLDPTTIPKFVDPLPIPERVDGTKSLTTTAEEFQQRILPNSFYKSLPSSVEYRYVHTGDPAFVINPKKGTYCWGFKINDGQQDFGPSYPAPTIEAQRFTKTHVKYVNNLRPFKDETGRTLAGPLLQKFLTVDLSFQWANPLNFPNSGKDLTHTIHRSIPLALDCRRVTQAFMRDRSPWSCICTDLKLLPSRMETPDAWFTPGKKIVGPTFVSEKYVYPNTSLPQPCGFTITCLGKHV